MSKTAEILTMPGAKAPPRQKSDQAFAKDLRAIHRKACKLIEDARRSGLAVDFKIETNGIGFIYRIEPTITRKL